MKAGFLRPATMNAPIMRTHLRRLDRIWVDNPIYFITICTNNRRAVLASELIHSIFREVWGNAEKLYRWYVGRYVIMPDHVHFFCASHAEATTLSRFVGKWKEWTAKYAHRRFGILLPLWQVEFFDHVLRSSESYEEKWEYTRDNPVRANLAPRSQDWPYQGELHDLRLEL
jgi:REP element-mobilizing transposase RayT